MAVEYPRRAVIVERLAAPRGQRRARRGEDLSRAAEAVVPLKDALRQECGVSATSRLHPRQLIG